MAVKLQEENKLLLKEKDEPIRERFKELMEIVAPYVEKRKLQCSLRRICYAEVNMTEAALRSKMKVKALKECDQLAAKYAECATGKTISVIWQCRKQAKELNECLHQFTNDSVLEEMKKQYTLQQDAQGSLRT